MKFLLHIILLVVVAGVGTLWASSHLWPGQRTFTIGGWVYHVQSRGGAVAVDYFSTMAEDEAYHHFALRYWMVEAVALPVVVFLWVRFVRNRRRMRGFPV